MTYYTGYESGLAIFNGSPIDQFAIWVTELKEALDNKTPIWSYTTEHGYKPLRNYNNEPYKEGDLVYNRDKAPVGCHIDEDDWILNYEPRCRPWYNMAW